MQTTDGMNSNFRILVVEDSFINQRVLSLVLSKQGYEVDFANNGFEGITLLAQNDYNLILMDVNMPVMNGYEATRLIRRNEDIETKNNIPIIALTGNVGIEEEGNCLDAGMNDFISKPIDKDILVHKIEKWVPQDELV